MQELGKFETSKKNKKTDFSGFPLGTLYKG